MLQDERATISVQSLDFTKFRLNKKDKSSQQDRGTSTLEQIYVPLLLIRWCRLVSTTAPVSQIGYKKRGKSKKVVGQQRELIKTKSTAAMFNIVQATTENLPTWTGDWRVLSPESFREWHRLENDTQPSIKSITFKIPINLQVQNSESPILTNSITNFRQRNKNVLCE